MNMQRTEQCTEETGKEICTLPMCVHMLCFKNWVWPSCKQANTWFILMYNEFSKSLNSNPLICQSKEH